VTSSAWAAQVGSAVHTLVPGLAGGSQLNSKAAARESEASPVAEPELTFTTESMAPFGESDCDVLSGLGIRSSGANLDAMDIAAPLRRTGCPCLRESSR